MVREDWTLENDLKLLELTIKFKKKWSYIANEYFPNKTQHSIKNRAIRLLSSYLCLNRKEIHLLLKNDWISDTMKTIELIKQKQFEQNCFNHNTKSTEKIEKETNFNSNFSINNNLIHGHSMSNNNMNQNILCGNVISQYNFNSFQLNTVYSNNMNLHPYFFGNMVNFHQD